MISEATTSSPDPNRPLLVGLPEAATKLGISRSSLQRLINRGELQTRKVGGRTLVRTNELERFADGSKLNTLN
jgi:excisionase family DNA binding protein